MLLWDYYFERTAFLIQGIVPAPKCDYAAHQGREQIEFSTNIWGKTRATAEQVMLIKNSICECRLLCWEVFGRWANPGDNFLFMRGKNKLSKKLLTVLCYCFDRSWMCNKKICVKTLCNLLVCAVTFFIYCPCAEWGDIAKSNYSAEYNISRGFK